MGRPEASAEAARETAWPLLPRAGADRKRAMAAAREARYLSAAMTNLRTRLEPVITPAFRIWWRFSRGTTLGVRGLATDEAGRILLVRHTYRRGWYLPGGGVESGETARYALEREMAEEGGVQATAPPLLIGIFANHASFKNDHVLLYRVSAWKPCAPLDNHEIAERAFFALDELPADTNRGTRRRLAEIYEGAAPTAEW